MDLKATYNLLAEAWHKDHKSDTWWIEGTDQFANFLNSGSTVLDVGCGAGIKSKYLISKGLKVTGIDFSGNLIKIAKREVVNGEFMLLDIREADKLEQGFDGIFAQASLLHIPKNEIEKAVRVLYNKLKDGGYFYIAVKEKGANGPEEEIKQENGYGYDYERFFSYFSIDEIKEHLRKLNMAICYESITPSGNTRWIHIIGRK